MSSILESLDSIIADLQAAREDAEKFDGGNASAGTRVRKVAQAGKKALHSLRGEVQEIKTARKAD